ncbi:MAG: nuclease-related domain-containing protein [Pseudomonadota bacterium]
MIKRWVASLVDSPEKARARVGAMLESSGLPYVRDAVIPDRIGGYTEVGHMLLTAEGILLVESEYFRGAVHSSAFTMNWTCFEGHERHVFRNPMHRQRELADTLDKMILGERVGVGVRTCFVICGPVRFASETPDGVLPEARLRDYLVERGGAPTARQRAVWSVLLSRVACQPVAPFGIVNEGSHAHLSTRCPS